MKYVLIGIRTALSLRLRSIRGWTILLLLPLIVCATNVFLPKGEVSAPVQVGVCMPRQGAEDLWELLEARNGTLLCFIPADEEEINRNVATGLWDCGLIVREDFQERLEELNTDRIFTLRTSSNSVVYPLVRESVSSCMAELISGDIAREYLLDSGIAENEEALLNGSFQLEVLDEANRVSISLSTANGEQLRTVELAEKSVKSVMRWIISVVILVWMLLSATDLGRWIKSSAVNRMLALRSETILMISRVGADALLAAIAGCVAQLLLGGDILSYGAIVCYVLFWMTMAVLCAHLRMVWMFLPVCMPFLVVISLLLSGVLVDASWLFPELACITEVLPVSLFLRNELESLLCLMGMSAACLAVSATMDRCCKRRKCG